MKVVFIGTGNMAQAIIKGILNKDFIKANDIYCSNPEIEHLMEFQNQTQVNLTTDNNEVVDNVDLLIICVKPQMYEIVLTPLKNKIIDNQLCVVSIAAGTTLETIQNYLNSSCSIIRVMPNICASINQSTTAITSINTKDSIFDFVFRLFQAIGNVYKIEEKLFPVFTGIAGCSPAFTFMYIDALARAALKNGLPKDVANQIAASAVLGASKMVLESELSPNDLVELVCSPAGTTIAGVCSLKDSAFEADVINAVDATIKRDSELKSK